MYLVRMKMTWKLIFKHTLIINRLICVWFVYIPFSLFVCTIFLPVEDAGSRDQ